VTDRVLVIGVGNDLRGDDAAGRVVADAFDGRDGVTVRSLPQLVPELVEDLDAVDRAIFVDADIDATGVTVRPALASGRATMSHHGDPGALLELARSTGRNSPDAMIVSIPASAFGLGTGLSAATASAVEEAITLISQLLAPAQGAKTDAAASLRPG
jgi:hydrogenase maturation protease